MREKNALNRNNNNVDDSNQAYSATFDRKVRINVILCRAESESKMLPPLSNMEKQQSVSYYCIQRHVRHIDEECCEEGNRLLLAGDPH